MTCEYTWPNHLLGSDKEAVSALLEQHGLQGDVAFGHSKLFIRSPRTLVTLEQSRARLIPIIVLLLQKVRGGGAGWIPTMVEMGVHIKPAEYASPFPLLMVSLIFGSHVWVLGYLPCKIFSLSSDGHILGMSLCLWEL